MSGTVRSTPNQMRHGLEKSDVGGFAMVPHWVLEAIENATTLKVWCVLCRHANTMGEAFPSIERLTTLANVSPSTLRRCLNELQVIGALEIRTRHDESGRQQSNLFYLRMAHPSSRHDILGAIDAGRVSPMTPSEGVTHGGGEGTTHDGHNKNQLEQETTKPPEVPSDVSLMLQTAALGTVPDESAELFPDEPERWWLYHEDALVRAFMDATSQIPKFAPNAPGKESAEKLVADLRAIAPDDSAVTYELGSWVIFNRHNPKKGGQKLPVLAFRNWCSKRQGSWALERDRRSKRRGQGRRRLDEDPLAAHARLMENGVEEPYS